MKNKRDPLEEYTEEEFEEFLLGFLEEREFEGAEEPDYWENISFSDEGYSIEDFFFPKNVSDSNVNPNQR
jgi:hypothetical protein